MFASFGSISFQPLASPTKLEIDKKYHYEALNVIGAPPVLQWIYDNLRHVELSIYLHNFWCKPQTAIDALTQLADFHVPQQFVFGNKNNLGTFVISNYRLKQRWMADDGSVIAAEMDLELTEYVAPSTLQSNTMTVGTIGNSTINTNPPGLTTSQSAAAGSTLVVSPATASPSGIPAQTPYTNVPLSTIARAA
jgi:phage protein U